MIFNKLKKTLYLPIFLISGKKKKFFFSKTLALPHTSPYVPPTACKVSQKTPRKLFQESCRKKGWKDERMDPNF